MQDLVIVGAGGWGVDAYDMIAHINKAYAAKDELVPYRILGFIDDNPHALDEVSGVDAQIIGDIKTWQPTVAEHYVLGVANPATRENLAKEMKSRGAYFETIVAPGVSIPEGVTVGEGCYIHAYGIGRNVKFGDFVQVSSVAIGKGVEIGDYSVAGAFANLADCVIGKRVFIGSHAVLLNHAKIGDDAIVSACSMVINNVKPGTKVFGVPARRMDL